MHSLVLRQTNEEFDVELALYYSPAACSQCAHIALVETGLPFDPRPVPFAEEANRTKAYLAINPKGFVPVLILDGSVITELAGILSFIGALAPELMPKPGTLAHARALEWLAWMSSTFHVTYAQRFRPERFLPEGPERAVLTEYALGLLGQCNSRVESTIDSAWAVGENFTVVDAYIFPFYRWGARNGFDMKTLYPKWAAHTRQMLDRPSVQTVLVRERIAASDWIV